jgi:four helix bundle protein
MGQVGEVESPIASGDRLAARLLSNQEVCNVAQSSLTRGVATRRRLVHPAASDFVEKVSGIRAIRARGGQLRRAAFSVASNIVEGFARRHAKERLNFLNISQSSLAEVEYCIHVATRLGYLTRAEAESLQAEINQVGAPLAGLIRSGT